MFEQYVTLSCVSNEVGGDLIGNAKWTGVRLREVLAIAGVQPAATQLVGRSVDGWTAGMPTAWVMDPAREPMIALQDERRAAAAGPRLSGTPGRAWAVRLRLRDQVAQGARADHARGLQRLLGPAGLGEGRPDPDPVADRHATRRCCRGPDPHRRDRLGARSRDLQGGGRDRRCLARRPALDADLRRDVGPMGRGLAGNARPPRHPGPGHRLDRRSPDRAALAAGARRRARLAHR